MSYHELSIAERVTIPIGPLHGFGPRAIDRLLHRSPSTVSRERRHNTTMGRYVAPVAQSQTVERRKACRPVKKLLPASALFAWVITLLRQCVSPESIAGKRRRMSIPSVEHAYVCREILYNAIYALPVSEWRKALILCLRQGKSSRRPCHGGVNEHINGLIRQFLLKGTDLSVHSQEQLDEIAYLMNIRPHKHANSQCPIEVMTQVVGMHHAVPASVQ